MKTINRNKIQRMIDGYGTYAMGGSGSNGGDMPAGVATQAWTMENFLSIEFFSKLFKAYGPAEEEGDPDVEIVPNDVEGTISNIQAMFGFWTEQYISALGQGSGGGGGGGDLNEPLASINTAGLATHPGSAGQTIIWNGSAWVYGSVLNSGVTSVGLSAPTGFNVTGSPITTSGTLALSFASGYELPLAADTAKGVTAYGWGDHSLAGYALASNVYSKTDADAKFLTIAFFRSLFKAYTSASAEVVPNAGDTTTISSIKAMFGFWTDQYISALGQGSGGGGGITLNEPLASLNNAGLSAPSSAGQTLVWNGSAWKYSSTAGISTTSMNVGGSASISGALSVAGNITTSAGGFIVSSKDNTYVLLAGGGTKLLSEIGGGGAVNSITIGSGGTNYTPDANGIVTIPPYPSTANLVSGITVNGGTYTPSSGIVVLPAYPTVPTTISSFTNDSGYITNAALTGYLPLTGGTIAASKSDAALQVGNSYNNNITTIRCSYGGGYGVFIGISGTTSDKYIFKCVNSITNAEGAGEQNKFIVKGNGNVGIGTDPSYLLDVAGISRCEYVAFKNYNNTNNAGYVGRGGTTNNNIQLTAYSGNTLGLGANGTDNVVFVNSSLYVGIGTTSPSVKLEVIGSILGNSVGVRNGLSSQFMKADGSLDSNTYATTTSLGNYLPLTGGQLTNTTHNQPTLAIGSIYNNIITSVQCAYGGGYGLFIGSNSTESGVYLLNCTKGITNIGGSNGTTVFAVMNTGYVGVGTTSPYCELDVIGRAKCNYMYFKNYNNDNLAGYVGRGSGSNNTVYLVAYAGNGLGLGANGTDNVLFIDTALNVGIGTTTPSYKLHVNGSICGTSIIKSGGTSSQFLKADGSVDSTGYLPLTGGAILGSKADAVFEAGNVYKSNVVTMRCVYGDGYGVFIASSRSSSSYYLLNLCNNISAVSGAGAVTKFIVRCDGYVGIGTSSPSYLLDVRGVIYSNTGVYSAGYVTALSDARRKDVMGDVMLTAEDVANAPMIKFLWKDRANDGMQVGSIAQYWQRYLPEAIVEDKDGYLTMDYGIIALLSSIATARKVKDHERRIAELERENKELKERLNAA